MRSLRTRLLVTYVLTLVLTMALVSAGLAAFFPWSTGDVGRRGLANQAERLAGCLLAVPGRPPRFDTGCDFFWIYAAAPADLKYRLLDAAGAVVLSSDIGGGPFVPAAGSVPPNAGEPFDSRVEGLDLRVLTVPVAAAGSALLLQVARSERTAGLRLPTVGIPFVRGATLVLGSLLVFGVAVFFTLRKMLRPIREASLAASRIAPRSLSTRLVATTLPTELVPLIDAFNLALDRLERGYKVQQELLEAVAHELKTPLALIRAQIEMEDRPDRASLLVDVDFMARQVHQLLHLAEVSGPQNYRFEPIDVALVATEAADYLRRLADQRGVALAVRSLAPQLAAADRGALFVLFKNLVENAIQHSPAGGMVSIAIDARCVTVRDRGPGVARADLPHLFERFWRGATSHAQGDGAGLGLAICSEIAQAHGWTLSASNVTPGIAFELVFG